MLCKQGLFLLLVTIAMWSTPVSSHGGHDDRIKVRQAANSLVIDTHLSVRLLAQFDPDHDGSLTMKEYRAVTPDIKKWIGKRISVNNGHHAMIPAFFDLPVSVGNTGKDEGIIEYVRLVQRYDQPAAGTYTLYLNLPEQKGRTLLIWSAKGSRKLILKAAEMKITL